MRTKPNPKNTFFHLFTSSQIHFRFCVPPPSLWHWGWGMGSVVSSLPVVSAASSSGGGLLTLFSCFTVETP